MPQLRAMIREIDHAEVLERAMMSDACPDDNTLVELAEAVLDIDRANGVEAHVDRCSRCAGVLAGFALASARSGDGAGGLPRGIDGGRLPRGAQVGRYAIRDITGVGAMGTVYSARDPELQRDVALKVLHPRIALGPGAQSRVMREARALARLAHPNVVTVHDVGRAGDHVFVVMELVSGSTLTAWLAAADRSPAALRQVFLDVARGLEAAHAAGVVHRDVKPDNILIGSDGRARIGDFGLARAAVLGAESLDGSIAASTHTGSLIATAAGAMIGTPAYMAPEQLRGEPCDARADQFAFCVALFEAWERRRPFAGDSAGALAASIGAGVIAPPTRMPAGLWHVVQRGLAGAPASRYSGMSALVAALEAPVDTSKPLVTWQRAGHASAALGLLGTCMDWVSAPILSRSGLDTGDGKLVALMTLAALITGLVHARQGRSGRAAGWVYLLIGLVGVGVVSHDVSELRRAVPPNMAGLIAPGAGMLLDFVAFVAMSVVGIALVVRARRARRAGLAVASSPR